MSPISEIDSHNIIQNKPNNQHMDFENPTACGFKEAFDRTSATVNDLDHDIWPWRWPWIINIISEMDSGGQNYVEKRYYLTFSAY